MNRALPEPVRQIARDLIQKRLWPIAVLLIAGLVAIPLLLGGGAQQAPAPVPAVAAVPVEAASSSAVTVVEQPVTGKPDRPGRISDPFYDPPAPPAADGGAAPAAVSGGAPAPASASSGATAAAKTTSKKRPAPRAAPRRSPAAVFYRAVVGWHATARPRPRAIARLTPLGGRDEPAALYLGVSKGEATSAVFLLAPGATSGGDGRCHDDGCRVIALRSGESRRVAVPSPDGGPARRFTLDVSTVRSVRRSARTVRAMRAQVHAGGRDVMRAMWQDAGTAAALGPLRYDPQRGLLYATTAAEKNAK